MSRKHSTRRLQIESLEARQLMAADLYLDFGAAFNFNASQATHLFQVEMQNDNRVNAPVDERIPTQLTSLADAVISRGMDYDQNGSVNLLDADAIALDVAEMVSRMYEPFAVNVRIVSSASMTQVIDKLDDHSTNDAYILVAGRTESDTLYGIAQLNTGNTRDNVAFAFAENILDNAASLVGNGAHPWSYVVQALARTAAHEAAHTFGLDHLLRTERGEDDPADMPILTADQTLLAGSDTMFIGDNGRFRYMNLATRWDGLPTEDGAQNSFNVLATNVGLNANGLAYVTGTGAHDRILIEGINNDQARVTVSAFRDGGLSSLIEAQAYVVSAAKGIIVEAGRGNDWVEVVNLSVPVTLRGGAGDDMLIGANGNDTFEGDTGNDHLFGGAGSDTYLFRGPRFQDHNYDDINDASGAEDVLDFSGLDFAVNVNLASTVSQQVERRPTTTVSLPTGQVIEGVEMTWLPFNSRLDLDLKSGTGSTGIENVRGSRFADRIHGNELDNDFFGNAGNDWLFGYDGLDMLNGGLGDDILRGGNARDQLFGELGRDQLFGEAGNDRLDGGFDGMLDVLNGGEGADEFVHFYRWIWTPLWNTPHFVRSHRLIEGESLADFSAGLGDVTVKVTV